MPLSEHEQRVLREIEKSFYEQDPAFAGRVGRRAVHRAASRDCKRSVLAFFVGLGLLLATFSSSVVLGAAGFVIMLFSVVWFEKSLRQMGELGGSRFALRLRRQFEGSWSAIAERARRRSSRPQKSG